MKNAIIIAALVIGGCGTLCQTESTAVEGLATHVASLEPGEEREQAEEQLQAAQQALESCEMEQTGEWLVMILRLFLKVASS
ncbi:MAG: hypothetical protein ACYTBJ_02315 [Planctomycetota bacterium]